LDSAFKTSAKTFLPISLVYILTYFLIIAIVLFTLLVGIGLSFSDFSAFSDPSAMSNPEAMMNNYASLASRIFTGTGIVFILIAYLFIFFIMSWFYNFTFTLIHHYVETKEINLGHSFSNSFSSKVPKLFLLSILSALLFVVVYLAFILVTFALGSISQYLAFFGGIFTFFGIMITMIKLSLAFPIFILTEKGIIESLKESITAIDIKTAFKYSLYTLLGSIVFTVLLIIVMFLIVGGSFMLHKGLGVLAYIVSLILVGGFIFTFISSLILGLFYKHSYIHSSSELELEENLIL